MWGTVGYEMDQGTKTLAFVALADLKNTCIPLIKTLMGRFHTIYGIFYHFVYIMHRSLSVE